ncbi:ROK family protein [Mesorhizobium sp. CA18]|uniref:ROK family protein n=1 Tax=unclassified Mesorhizobium TaxID=325217 RepID=UPI001CCBEFB3|nr:MULTISPECIES: ROK family protein [unclassified Mesorhizobium]MBZ9737139.1 ROK family protein [Mesorhizobium sp. CA9]MBZ9826589.1 ROK family protein [Mesorhizobium sp. CA18]MBZ9830816.1 ROK family protein [Mesorhizobium sp. CA2]MBZ9835508.1 ROK family protein [Mesorhizobium sp. CA3]MBZ9875808.1 ROK family protein [Mesorhizobium sp. Ca11]
MNDKEIAVFDIGGTHFRSALWSNGQLGSVTRRPAINYLNTAHHSPVELQEALADYLVTETERLQLESENPIKHVGISLGAPVNACSGCVLKSGPLWGPRSGSFELQAALTSRRLDIRWTVANDVTAGLVSHIQTCDPGRDSRILFVTVSTGIGSRLYDFARGGVPVDPVHGIQGEIGHLKVEAFFRGTRLKSTCDCGGCDHLNAYSSGRGVLKLLRELSSLSPEALAVSTMAAARDEDDDTMLAAFSRGVASADALALDVLATITRPLATIFSAVLTHDPLLGSIVLTGGVVDALEPAYSASLDRQFRNHGLYQITECDSSYFSRRLRIVSPGNLSGLIGAGHLAEMAAEGRNIHVFR